MIHEYGYLSLNASVQPESNIYYPSIGLTLSDGWTLLSDYISLQFNMEELSFSSENAYKKALFNL